MERRPAQSCDRRGRGEPAASSGPLAGGRQGGRRWVLLLGLLLGLGGSGSALGQEPAARQEAPLPVAADYALRLGSALESTLSLAAAKGGPATVLLHGLRHGGAVHIAVNGQAPASVELLASGGLTQGRADAALLSAELLAGPNDIRVSEIDGVQVVRVPGTNHWFGTTSQAKGSPVFSVNLDDLLRLRNQYAVTVRYGPQWREFLYFSGRWDCYYGAVIGDRISQARGDSGPHAATLAYTLEDSSRNLVTPTHLTLIPDPVTGACTLRVRQSLGAVGDPHLPENLEFLHLELDRKGAGDWGDGRCDYAWYRTPEGSSPDALPGSHTGMVRVDDNSRRVYRYPASTADPAKTAVSGTHHTGAAVSLGAANAVGGFLTKTGVGSCGWLFHRYQASFRKDLHPLYSHCGDGADTHFYLYWGELFAPLGLQSGDTVEAEYSLTMLPSEVTREDIEDLNEADWAIFGGAGEHLAPITGWVGSKDAVGLQRGDGSLIVLGIGPEPATFPVPTASRGRVRRAYRLADLGDPHCDMLEANLDPLEVRPGWLTVLDCGAALLKPVAQPKKKLPKLQRMSGLTSAREPAVFPAPAER